MSSFATQYDRFPAKCKEAAEQSYLCVLGTVCPVDFDKMIACMKQNESQSAETSMTNCKVHMDAMQGCMQAFETAVAESYLDGAGPRT